MAGEGTSDGKGGNRIPIWCGRPENFHHFTQEISCYLAGTTSSERPCAAARLIRRFLENDYSALRSLMYRLELAGFVGEEAIGALIKFLEESPMNKQPSPGAGAKLTACYRRLARKPGETSGETMPQFLTREETPYDNMWRSLQCLLREKALDFSKYGVTMAELKTFCGMRVDAS